MTETAAPAEARCPGSWWSRLPAMYAEPIAATADRTPCRCASCAPAPASQCQAERNGRILASRIPPSRRWQLDTSPSAACLTTQASYGEQRARIDDRTPAADQGLTLLQACATFGKPYREAYRAFTWGIAQRAAPLGKRDHFDVWFAPRSDLHAVWGQANRQKAAQASAHEWMTRTAQRMARRAARMTGDKAA